MNSDFMEKKIEAAMHMAGRCQGDFQDILVLFQLYYVLSIQHVDQKEWLSHWEERNAFAKMNVNTLRQ